MNKPLAVVSCPIDTYSGYGARARDFVKAMYETKKEEWDIKVLPQRWGNTAWGYIKDNEQDWGFLNDMLLPQGQLPIQPDYWFQVTIPNEFQQVGKLVNVGVTAGIETTVCDPTWIDGINRMNVTYVSSEFGKAVFKESTFQEKNQQGQIVRDIKLQKPVETFFEGVDTKKYFYIDDEKIEGTDLVLALDDIKEDFNYLFVGHWIGGEIGEDRKNVGLTIKLFLETFKGKKNRPGLILKTTTVGNSIMDRDSVLEKIEQIRNMVGGEDLPNIYLLHGDLSDEDMNNLYNHGKVKAMICLTKGEGWGRPMLEFSVSKKPIIASGWSAQVDFLDKEFTPLVSGEVKQIHPSAVVPNILIAESSWFYPSVKEAQFYLEDVFANYKKYEEKAKRQARKSITEFSFEKMKELFIERTKYFPKKQEIKLPTLQKIQLPQLNK